MPSIRQSTCHLIVSDIAVFVLKRDVKQLTNLLLEFVLEHTDLQTTNTQITIFKFLDYKSCSYKISTYQDTAKTESCCCHELIN